MKNFYFDVISGRRSDFLAKACYAFLFIISLFFSVAVFFRKKLYELGLFSSYRPKAYTISVGNIVAGGSGKTPCTLYLAEMLSKKYACSIVVRPYKAKKAQKNPIRVKATDDPEVVGDEACLLARRLPNVSVWSGKKKKAAKCADASGTDVIIIDDGFQHFGLKRDLDIVIIDAVNPFGYNALLPCGMLREPISAIRRADRVVCNSKCIEHTTKALEEKLRLYTDAPIIHVGYSFEGVYERNNRPIFLAVHIKVALFCGIANPENFKEFMQNQGFCVVETLFVGDHNVPSTNALQRFCFDAAAKGAACILCTEKDFVKVETTEMALPLYWIKISMHVFDGEDLLLMV